MSTPPASARVFGYVAAEADVCVLLRRGPSRQVLMVRWDLATDEFEIGQWLKAQVYERESDLSPDGRLFAYQANDGQYQSETRGVYSVVCRPPYFTALAFWSQGSTHYQGFRWSKSPRLLGPVVPPPTKGVLPPLYGRLLRKSNARKSAIERGWRVESGWQTALLTRDSSIGQLRWHRSENGFVSNYWLGDRPLDSDWADVDHRGRLLLAREGRVLVRDADGERELIDLNPFNFQPVAPPAWATQWP